MSSRTLRPRTKRAAEDKSSKRNEPTQAKPPKKQKTMVSSTKEGNPKSSAGPKNTSEQTESTHHDVLTLSESTGDIFAAPPDTLLIHACNCEGSWGGGIAVAFKNHYPKSYEVYAHYCATHTPDELAGTALLIPPQTETADKRHFVGCLFTSRSKGKKKDSAETILGATAPAMRDLMIRVREWNRNVTGHNKNLDEGDANAIGDVPNPKTKVREVRMCKINSGLFAVPWEKSKAALEAIEVDKHDFEKVEVITRPE